MNINKYTSLEVYRKKINGLEYAYFLEGEGPLIVCLHGFPDNAITYENTIKYFCERDYRVLAPFLRGYFPSALSPKNDYSVYSVALDFLKLIEEIGEKQFFLIGHDWGASTAYCMANLAPEQVLKLITIAIPHPRVLKPNLKMLWRAKHFILFQFKKYGAWYTRRNNYQYLDYIYHYWSPNWDMPKEHNQMIKESFEEKGYLDGALGYYQTVGKELKDKEKQRVYNKITSVETLCFAGTKDGAIDIRNFEGMDKAFSNGYEFEVVENAGHFLHQEASGVFHERVLDFIKNEKS